MRFVILFALAGVACLAGADWLSDRGDADRSGWQRHETQIDSASIGQLKLLWKRHLDGVDSLTTPVILGPIFTHRGIKELVFVAGAKDTLFAVDADLGRLFWTRHIESVAATQPACDSIGPAAPVISPAREASQTEDPTEPRSPLRPIYFVSRDGYLHRIRPSTGQDMTAPLPFLPANTRVVSLNLVAGTVYAQTRVDCTTDREEAWSIAVDGKQEAVAKRENNAGLDRITDSPYAGYAVAEDARGVHWNYFARIAPQPAIVASQVHGTVASPRLDDVWKFDTSGRPLAPIVANGIVYAVSAGDAAHATLYALDAATGKQLYSSGDAITSSVRSSGLAMANGHICFGTTDNTLYCFGLPLEIY